MVGFHWHFRSFCLHYLYPYLEISALWVLGLELIKMLKSLLTLFPAKCNIKKAYKVKKTSLGRTIVCLHDCYLFDDNSSYFMKVCFHLIADLFSKILATVTVIGIIWKLSCNVDICKKINVLSTNEQFCPFSLLTNHLMVQS